MNYGLMYAAPLKSEQFNFESKPKMFKAPLTSFSASVRN